METFQGLQSKYEGLWYHPETHGMISNVISLGTLKKFKGNVRVYVRKNKFYEKDSNRPNYVFSIKEVSSPVFKNLEVEAERAPDKYAEMNDDGYWYTSDGERLFTRDEVQYAIDRASDDGARGFTSGNNLVSDYL